MINNKIKFLFCTMKEHYNTKIIIRKHVLCKRCVVHKLLHIATNCTLTQCTVQCRRCSVHLLIGNAHKVGTLAVPFLCCHTAVLCTISSKINVTLKVSNCSSRDFIKIAKWYIWWNDQVSLCSHDIKFHYIVMWDYIQITF